MKAAFCHGAHQRAVVSQRLPGLPLAHPGRPVRAPCTSRLATQELRHLRSVRVIPCAAAEDRKMSTEQVTALEDVLAAEYDPDRLMLDVEDGVLKLQLAANVFDGMAMTDRQQLLSQFLDNHAPGMPRELLLMTPREYFAAHLKKWC